MTSGPRKRTAVRRRGTRVAATTPDHLPNRAKVRLLSLHEV
jgi:hypothetical protein